MDTQASSTTLVRHMRTFADDVRRAQAEGTQTTAVPPQKPHSVTTAALQNTPKPPTPIPETPEIKKSTPSLQHSAAMTEAVRALPPTMTKASHLSDEGKLLDIRGESGQAPKEGTIVKDTRRKKWSLTSALSHSLKDWVGEQQDSIATMVERQNPKPKVPPSETRSNIIQAAKSKSSIAARDDRSAVIEKLRTFARDAERVTGKKYTIAKHAPGKEENPTWTHTTDKSGDAKQTAAVVKVPTSSARHAEPVAYGLSDIAPQVPRSTAPLKQARKTIDTSRTPPLRSPSAAPTEPVAYGLADIAPQVAPAAPEEEKQTENDEALKARAAAIHKLLTVHKGVPVEPAPPSPAEKTPEASRDIAFSVPQFEDQKTTNYRTYRNDAISDVRENQRSIPDIAAAEEKRRRAETSAAAHSSHGVSPRPFAIAGFIMIGLIAIGGFGFFWYGSQDASEIPTAAGVVALIDVDAQKPVSFSTNRSMLLDTLTEAVAASGRGITQIYPTYGESGASAAPTSDFMFVLDPRAPGSFIRNLSEDMMIGSYNGTDPFFVLRTEQFETAFAGMIDWEPYMSADLTPLFGTPVRSTLDPTARTSTRTRDAFFVDGSVQNIDVRILYDDIGEERIVYAFLDRRTILITTSTEALEKLIDRAR